MDNAYAAYYTSPLGKLQVSCNETCITQVHFCNESGTMGGLQNYPDASSNAPAMLQECVEQLLQYFNGHLKYFTIPVAQEGTAFQQRVWNELLQIPYGRTISYLALAKRLGDPKVIRAAASTNGKNNIAIIVPCHRVIGSNNDLIGYAGGLWRKRRLLELETKITHGVQTLF